MCISEPPAVMRFTARPDKIEHTTARSFRFLEELNDPFGGTSLFSYDAKIFDHVHIKSAGRNAIPWRSFNQKRLANA